VFPGGGGGGGGGGAGAASRGGASLVELVIGEGLPWWRRRGLSSGYFDSGT